MSTTQTLLANPATLPTVPKVVQQLIQSLGREDVAIGELVGQLGADPVLSAKTLRLANSAYFRVSRRIGTLDDALRLLGFSMVRNLVVGCGVSGAFKSVPGLDLPQFWRFSLHTAVGARWLAQQCREDDALAFSAGLMHALGQLVLQSGQADADPALVAELNARVHPLAAHRAAEESALLGFHHGEVSRELALYWKFPHELAEPLAAVPDPTAVDLHGPWAGNGRRMSALLHIAAWHARRALFRPGLAQVQQSLPQSAADLLGLTLRCAADSATVAIVTSAGAEHALPDLDTLTQGLDTMFG